MSGCECIHRLCNFRNAVPIQDCLGGVQLRRVNVNAESIAKSSLSGIGANCAVGFRNTTFTVALPESDACCVNADGIHARRGCGRAQPVRANGSSVSDTGSTNPIGVPVVRHELQEQ